MEYGERAIEISEDMTIDIAGHEERSPGEPSAVLRIDIDT